MTVVENTRKYICHKLRRELIAGALKVYPIKDYGAIGEGEHRICQLDSGECEGVARFLMIREQANGRWRMTRCPAMAIGRCGRTTARPTREPPPARRVGLAKVSRRWRR